jgi:hypothetical protein
VPIDEKQLAQHRLKIRFCLFCAGWRPPGDSLHKLILANYKTTHQLTLLDKK